MKFSQLYYIYSFAIISLFAVNFKGFAQTPDSEAIHNSYSLQLNAARGFILRHSDRMGHLVQGRPWSIESSIIRHTYGEKDWQILYNYPDIGFSLTYYDLDEPILGEMISALAFIDFYLLRSERQQITFRLGTGLGYANHPYDPETNNRNIAISSAISFGLQTQLAYEFNISESWSVLPAVRLTHFSNGGLKLPNSGINIVQYSLGFRHHLTNVRPEYSSDISSEFTKSGAVHWHTFVGGGVKGVENSENSPLGFVNVSSYAAVQVGRKSSLNLGMDGFYNRAYQHNLENTPETAGTDFRRIGLIAGHELQFSNFSILTQMGYYLYKKGGNHPDIYQRYGLKYYLNSKLFVATQMKAHFGRADLVEWGIGIRL